MMRTIVTVYNFLNYMPRPHFLISPLLILRGIELKMLGGPVQSAPTPAAQDKSSRDKGKNNEIRQTELAEVSVLPATCRGLNGKLILGTKKALFSR